MKRTMLMSVLVLGLIAPAAAEASSINYNCGTCGSHNTSFDVTYTSLDPLANTYQLVITATYQPLGAGVPDFTYLNAVAFKLANVSYENGTPSFVSGPAEDTWTLFAGGLSAGGCNGAGAGFYCFGSTGSGATRGGPGSTDTWIVTLNLPGTTPLPSSIGLTIKAQFTNSLGEKVGSLISDEGFGYFDGGTPPDFPNDAVPEPASIALLGSGLVFMASQLKRMRRKN